MLILAPPFSLLQEDEFAGLSGSAQKDSTSHPDQDELNPAAGAKDAPLLAVHQPAQAMVDVDTALPYVPEVLVQFCMS